jgi:16S rRNA (uracil1498-N3)-methyltransferase
VQPHGGTIEKLKRYVIEASKQCGRNVLMGVKTAVDWESYCGRGESGELRIFAHPSPGRDKTAHAKRACGRIRCAVGPEGGFTDEEIVLALAHGWHVMDLGPRILRVETAALVLATYASFIGSLVSSGEPGG